MQHLISLSDEDIEQIDLEIQQIVDTTSRQARDLVSSLVRQNRKQFSGRFYEAMLKYPGSQFFLENNIVNERLVSAMESWLLDLFKSDSVASQHIRMRQMEVGAVHARIRVPVSLVMRGFRDLKRDMIEALRFTRNSPGDIVEAASFIAALLDVSLAIMTAAYVRHSEKGVRAEEALRLFSMAQDMAAERERQRASLAEWAQNVFFTAQLEGGLEGISPLGQSDFALWFIHRANLLFGETNEYRIISEAIARCDEGFLALRDKKKDENRVRLIMNIKESIDGISSMMNIMFSDVGAEENSRDPLTKLYNRKFLLTIISRDIGIHKKNGSTFSTVIFSIGEIDSLKNAESTKFVEDLIRKCSQLIIDSSRSSDTIFRISEGQFLVVRVGSSRENAERYALGVANGFKALHFNFNGLGEGKVTLAYSVTEYDGHPDPRHVIRNAERAPLKTPQGAQSLARG